MANEQHWCWPKHSSQTWFPPTEISLIVKVLGEDDKHLSGDGIGVSLNLQLDCCLTHGGAHDNNLYTILCFCT